MAKVAVPILKLTYNQRDAYPNAITEIFQNEKAWDNEDEFTFTGGVSLPNNGIDCAPKRARIRLELAALFVKHYGKDKFDEPFKTLMKILDDNDWCVSFYVDSL